MSYATFNHGGIPFVAGSAASLVTLYAEISFVTIAESVIAGLMVTAIWNSGRWIFNRLRHRWFRP